MKNLAVTLMGEDKNEIILKFFPSPAEKPVGSVVIIHGAADHSERYQHFIDFLNENNLDAYIYDLRGHGHDTKFELLGSISEKNGHKLLVSDAVAVLNYVHDNNRARKLILFGHDLGAVIGQNAIQVCEHPDVCIFCGTPYYSSLKCFSLGFWSALTCLKKGDSHYSPFLSGRINNHKGFSDISDRTAYDWLSRDNAVVGAYINDAYTGFLLTASYYNDIVKLTKSACSPSGIKRINRDMRIVFMSGSHDPVGGYGQGVTTLFNLYQKLGFADSDCIIYDEARHELLNETCKEDVMNDILVSIGVSGSGQ
ncbi:MAG: alpha/beta hydrolase [Lachnospiraceae bacterium]|jgi:alpha-beta hydrolase superfamily lysophospholipase|nr:alpha/beta hydrolase [Lachnospiraceae bacterium]